MKKKILILSSLLISTNLSAVVACTNQPPTPTPNQDWEIVVPNSYNLTSELKELNELDFKNQKPTENLEDYSFTNSWFMNFETTNQNKVIFEGTKINQMKFPWFLHIFDYWNGGSRQQTWIAREQTEVSIEHANTNYLTWISSKLDLNQNFHIESKNSDFNFGQKNALSLTSHPNFVDYDHSSILLSKKEFQVLPWSAWRYQWDVILSINQVEGLLKFSLNQNTKIAYQIENNLTHQKSVYFYTIKDLTKKYSSDSEYQKVLSNKEGFLYYNSKTDFFNLQIQSQFNLLDDRLEEYDNLCRILYKSDFF